MFIVFLFCVIYLFCSYFFFLIGTKCGRVTESKRNVRSDLLCVTLMKLLFVYVCVFERATIFQVCEVLCSVMIELVP